MRREGSFGPWSVENFLGRAYFLASGCWESCVVGHCWLLVLFSFLLFLAMGFPYPFFWRWMCGDCRRGRKEESDVQAKCLFIIVEILFFIMLNGST
jgi:hypothetical protein